MSVKHIGLSGLVLALSGLAMVRAQEPAAAPGGADVLPLYTPGGSDAATPFASSSSAGLPSLPSSSSTAPAGTNAQGIALDEGSPPIPPPILPPLGQPASPWLVYPRSPCSCGPVGGKCSGPLGYELFFRSGMAFPIGGNLFDRYLHTGWDVEAGGRLLLFNQPATKAWTVTVGISNIFARTGNANQPLTLYNVPVRTAVDSSGHVPKPGSIEAVTPAIVQVPQLTATISSLNMTFVNAGFGRDWWLCGSAYPGKSAGFNWRVGVEGGGRYGTNLVQFNEINHFTNRCGGMYAAVHTYVDYPWRCGFIFGGVRYEYNYIWSSILQDQNNSNYQSMNLLFQIGARF